jgi:hypothetical protein
MKPDERLTWSRCRKSEFDFVESVQRPEGNCAIGDPVRATATYMTLLQLDNAALPIYQR